MTPVEALEQIWNIVHTPTKATTHRSAERHFQSDFDEIRRIIAATITITPATRGGAST